MELELSDFDAKVRRIVKMDKDQVQAYMNEKGFNLLKGDLHLTEQDSIFYGLKVQDENVQWETEDNMDDLVNPTGHVGDAFLNKQWIWIVKE